MKLLLLSDLHFKSRGISSIPERNSEFGLEFLKRVIRRIKDEKIDVIVISGDLIDDNKNIYAEEDYIEIKKVVQNLNDKKILICPGNHDLRSDKFKNFFGEYKFAIFEDFLFYVFYDDYFEGDICKRNYEEIENFKKIIIENPEKKIIVIQHNLVYPKIESDYPFNILESEKIHNFYKENNVFLSISGHYHKGLDLVSKDNIYYFTIPSICEEPFKYFIFEIGSEIKINDRKLKNSAEIIDYHCHTEFGYCAEDVNMEKVIKRCKIFGVKKVYFTEHAGQLYLSPDDYWNYKFFNYPEILRKQRENKKDRIKEYIEKFKSLNSDMAGLGLEVEVDKNGNLTLIEEDRNFFEILVGSVHYLPDEWCSSKKEMEKYFLWSVEKLVENKIDILAHPFRFFFRKNIETPKTLYKEVVKILKEGNVKAEINFHHYYPEIDFFKMCVEENIEICFGSDSHNLLEVGEFSEYIEFLKELNL
ncbi:MAG: metallophosphoesterase [Candidatus Omnitrophica bacterium]|nr:metallophosphoesterase [Candidatus Omnitrophota bacterium]MCM8802949.1 metallophosphoesterase [Candidatus Omnitrophota bacterium]